ncbi:hypothetical protein HKX48_006881 [Thoreauomyces humboldtii]|nr:hypothetical protein HKX48_006881 [Thoreauomyces humboldtii]
MDFDSRSLQRIPSGVTTDFNQGPYRRNQSWISRLIPKDRWAKVAIIWSLVQFFPIVLAECIIAKEHSQYRAELQLVPTINVTGTQADNLKLLIANARALTVYHALFIVAQAFQLVLVADAVITSSMIQMVSTVFFNFALFAYAGLQYHQASSIGDLAANTLTGFTLPAPHPTKGLEVVVIIGMALFVTGWLVITQRLYRVFGWSVFKELGADIAVRNRLKLYHVYLMLLKLDVFFFLGFDVQFLVLVIINQASAGSSEKYTHGLIAMPLTLVLLVISYVAIRRESRILMTLTCLGLSGGIGYLIAKLVDISQNTEANKDKYTGSKASLTLFEVITLLLCVATFIVALLNYRNFGKGLKEQLNRARGRDLELDETNMGNRHADPYASSRARPGPNGNGKDDGRWSLE